MIPIKDKYIWFRWFGFYDISTIVAYEMTNALSTYILDIYDLIWFGFMVYQQLLVINAKFPLCI